MSYLVGFPSGLKALASAKTAKVAMEAAAEVLGSPRSTNVGHDRKLLIQDMNRSKRFQKIYEDIGPYGNHAYFDTLTGATITVRPDDTVSIASQETGNVSVASVHWYHSQIGHTAPEDLRKQIE